MVHSVTGRIGILVAALVALWGCSRAPLYLEQPPVQLAQQIAAADRVVLTNPPASSVVFSNAEAQKLVLAVSHAKKINLGSEGGVSCPAGFYIQFFRGTNLLAQVEGHDDHFRTAEGFYHDGSGVLQAAWQGPNK